MGGSFIRASLKVVYLTVTAPTGSVTFHVSGKDNTVLNVTGLAFSIKVSNSYFLPVLVNYRGPDLVVLVYNRTVSSPGDVASNSSVKWQVSASADIGDEDNVRFPAAQDFVEHVVSVPPVGVTFNFGDDNTVWNGIDIHTGRIVTPGTYYAYAIAFGRATPPVLLTVLGG